MPLEIRELIIRTQIISDETQNALASQQLHSEAVDTKEIVDQCVEKILKVLKKKMER